MTAPQPSEAPTEPVTYFATHKIYGYRVTVKTCGKNDSGEWCVKESGPRVHFNFYKDYVGPPSNLTRSRSNPDEVEQNTAGGY